MRAHKPHFDEHVPSDVQAVLDASALLGVPEFRIFQIAYRWWYGHDTDESTIERYFTPYMFGDAVPPWVRHFAHRVLRRDRDGTLDAAEFGIARPQASAGDRRRGRNFALWLVTILVTLILLAQLAATETCLFPPCY